MVVGVDVAVYCICCLGVAVYAAVYIVVELNAHGVGHVDVIAEWQ